MCCSIWYVTTVLKNSCVLFISMFKYDAPGQHVKRTYMLTLCMPSTSTCLLPVSGQLSVSIRLDHYSEIMTESVHISGSQWARRRTHPGAVIFVRTLDAAVVARSRKRRKNATLSN